MDLEQRVQALEEEVEILKNQIQATLLDIQEQLLTSAYPSLRSGSTPTGSSPRAAEESMTAQVKTFKPTADESGDKRSVNNAQIANVKKVSFEDSESSPVPAAAPERRDSPISWSSLDEMDEWVHEKVDKIGAERTRQLVYMYYENGRIAADHIDTLLQLVDLYDQESSRPFESAQAARSSPLPVWRSPARQVTPPTPAARAGQQKTATRPAAPRRPVQSDTDAPPAVTHNAPNPKPAAPKARSGKGASDSTRPAAPQANAANTKESSEPETQERATVLRLIAGIYNAGAGVKWGKKHG